ncbi:MAG: carbohydrate binding domain-containing protein, partial [Abditibacteriales bacterium]|nr:carbohydrate binding domain-containing protein [Abditibacteriales bacterium]MDW8368006.1 carbohydrate binding domain-containing protein [Abditibacteriales bacterium]
MTFHRFHHHGWLLLSVVVFASCLVEASEPSSRNLVQNGGFETPHPDDFLQPDQWADFQTSSRTAYRDRRTFHRGSVSLKLLTDPAAGTQQMYQRLHGVEAGDVLRVSFWAKTNGQVYGQVALLSGTIREAPQLLAEKSFRDGGWQPYTFTVTVPAGLTAPLAIHLGHANGKVAGGIVWFDDVTVVKTGRVPNPPRRVPKELVSNGGFEEVQNRGGHGGQPIEWTVRNLNPKEEKSVTFEVVAPGRSGARCVKIAGASADSFVALSQEVQGVNPGGWFVLRLAYRAEGEVKGGAMIVGLDERGNDVQLSIAGDFVPSREWRTMEHQFQLSPDAKSAQIVINVVGTSAVYVDDVSLTAGKLPSPAVARQPRLYPLPPLADIKTH